MTREKAAPLAEKAAQTDLRVDGQYSTTADVQGHAQTTACPECHHPGPHPISAGSGPHVASVRCAGCARWLKWLSKREFSRGWCGEEMAPSEQQALFHAVGLGEVRHG